MSRRDDPLSSGAGPGGQLQTDALGDASHGPEPKHETSDAVVAWSVKILAGLLVGLGVAVAGYVGLALKLRSDEVSLLFRPHREAMHVAAADVPGLQSVSIPTADGLHLTGWFLPPPPGQATILYMHGNGGSLMNRIGRVRRLAAHGYGLLFLEYRGYGGNPGIPSEGGLALDALGATDFLKTNGIESDRVVLYGESLGTSVAVTLANHRHVAGLVLDSPFTSIAAVAQQRYPLLPIGLMIRNRFDLIDRVATIGAPLLVIQGNLDRVIPPAMGRTVFAAAAQPKRFWAAPAAGHNNVLETGGEAVVAAFVADCVRH